jgi:soluble lytic murein transglycosylase
MKFAPRLTLSLRHRHPLIALQIIFLVAVSVGAGQQNREDSALTRLQRGYQSLQAKDYEGAAAILADSQLGRQTALGDYALYYRAQALNGLKRQEESEREYLRVTQTYRDSLLARSARIEAATSALGRDAHQAAIEYLKPLVAEDDGTALKLTADAFEESGRTPEAISTLRRLYFYAPQFAEASAAATRLTAIGSSVGASNADEARVRADRLYEAGLFALAAQAYDSLGRQFPAMATNEVWLRAGISSYRMSSPQSALDALARVRSRTPKEQSETLYYTGIAQIALRRTDAALATLNELRRADSNSERAGNLLYELGRSSDRAGQTAAAASYYEQLVKQFPRGEQADEAHFWLGWRAHETKDYRRSSDLLLEHLAEYSDSTDNRGKAAFWAAMDARRAGDKGRALTLFRALLKRYSAGWYGVNADRHIAELERAGVKAEVVAPNSQLARAIDGLQGIVVTPESIGQTERPRLEKAEQLMKIALYDQSMEELKAARATASNSPLINLRMAQVFRAQNENAAAINTLRRAYPDYAQALPEEMTREVWDIFYPLKYWTNIQQEARRHQIDPYLVAGLIRQETIFNPQARSRANAYGLMQLLPSTGRMVSRKYSLGGGSVTVADLYNPILNIQLGTAYLADMIDDFGRFEYAAAAYNGGPSRVTRWLRELPTGEIEEWVDSIPISETRLYVQGVWRNARQYQRLYDEHGRFRSIVPEAMKSR